MRWGAVRAGVAVVVLSSAVGCHGFEWSHGWRDGDDPVRSVRIAVRSDPVTVGAGELVAGDLVVVGGEATIDGEVERDLVVVAGRLRMGPSAAVGRDLVAVGNEETAIAPGVRVGGSQVAVNFPGIRWIVDNALYVWDNPLLALLVALLGLAVAVYLAWRVLIRGYGPERFHGTVEHFPVRAGIFGLLVQIVIGALALAAFLGRWTVGLVGVLGLAAFVLGFLGWVMVGVHVGRLIARRRGWTAGPFTYGLAGIAIVCLGSLIPVLGQIGALLASLVGVGALVAPAKESELPGSEAARP